MSSATPVITTPETEDNLWFGGGLLSFKVTTEQSGGALVLFEHAAAQGKRTPLHLHPDHDETGFLLEGELLLHVDGVETRVGPGAAFWIPRGVPHALLVTSEIARSVWVVTPGSAMEDFFRQAGEAAPDRTLPPPDIDIAHLIEVGERTGAMKVLGPPPFPTAAIG
ncbi:MAG TPA: cupin domain-containing protein [Ktedonobacterales bacterium]|jgi:quercetin dioxygenase-like cupin family protein